MTDAPTTRETADRETLVMQSIIDAHGQWEIENRNRKQGDGQLWQDGHVRLLAQAAIIATDHIGELSDVEGCSRQKFGVVREISESAIAVGAEQSANSVCLVTVIDVEIRPPSSGSVLTAQTAHAALIGKHLVVIRYPDTAILSELGFSGLAASPPSQDSVAEALGVFTVPAISCRSTLTASVPSGRMSTLLEIEVLDGKGLAALVANSCFHEAINEMICRNDQATTMIDHAELVRLAEAATPGPWQNGIEDLEGVVAPLNPGLGNVVCIPPKRNMYSSLEAWPDNAAFIAAANPATVLALLSEIAALRGELEASLEEADRLAYGCDDARLAAAEIRATQAVRQRDELRKALEPFAALADKFGCWSVVEVCAPEPGNTSPVIQPLPLSAFETAAALLANQGAE